MKMMHVRYLTFLHALASLLSDVLGQSPLSFRPTNNPRSPAGHDDRSHDCEHVTSTVPITSPPSKMPLSEDVNPTVAPGAKRIPNPPRLPTVDKRHRGPTDPPTPSPTLPPTGLSTSPPTSSPTSLPSHPPTGQPTLKPTLLPTMLPTSPPSLYPTASPTPKPSIFPTFPPTDQPTLQPTLIPTMLPTSPPSLPPTVLPTSPPTPSPTGLPTHSPSLLPTALPTPKPSLPPTLSPTASPTFPHVAVVCSSDLTCPSATPLTSGLTYNVDDNCGSSIPSTPSEDCQNPGQFSSFVGNWFVYTSTVKCSALVDSPGDVPFVYSGVCGSWTCVTPTLGGQAQASIGWQVSPNINYYVYTKLGGSSLTFTCLPN